MGFFEQIGSKVDQSVDRVMAWVENNRLDRFNENLKKKWPHFDKKKVIFYQYNARMYTCVVAIAKLNELGYELLSRPLFSPNIYLSKDFLFPNLNKSLGGMRFCSNANDELISQINTYSEDFDKYHYLGVQIPRKECRKGDKVEK